jgi:hypothetical protein
VGYAQTLADEVKEPLDGPATLPGATFAETIKIISPSRKIFILSNNNQQLAPGDFVTLVLDDERAIRAVVAKSHDGNVGIKVLRIYSLARWGRLRKGTEVRVLRGDDAMFGKKEEPKAVDASEEPPKIRDEDDLFNKNVVVDDETEIGDVEDTKRHIKPDNVVGIGFGMINQKDAVGGSQRATQLSFNWGYQFADNWFAECTSARQSYEDYPGPQIATVVNDGIGRIKYNFKAPLYSFIMPYVGFRGRQVSSPNAGTKTTAAQKEKELQLIDKLEKDGNGPVVGVTLLRRLVPGWFLRADLGTDVLNLGVAIEF